jgi:hypothetical protein
LITDPWFYVAAIPAVLLFGIAKGGFGGGLGVLAVPLMALVVSPLQAAAVLLPILQMAVAGTANPHPRLDGRYSRRYADIRLHECGDGKDHRRPRRDRLHRALRLLDTSQTGFSIAAFPAVCRDRRRCRRRLHEFHRPCRRPTDQHLPAQATARPHGLRRHNGTAVRCNQATSLVLAPLAPVGVYTGVWLHRRVSDSFFFRLMYVVLFVVGCKLLYDGVTAGH